MTRSRFLLDFDDDDRRRDSVESVPGFSTCPGDFFLVVDMKPNSTLPQVWDGVFAGVFVVFCDGGGVDDMVRTINVNLNLRVRYCFIAMGKMQNRLMIDRFMIVTKSNSKQAEMFQTSWWSTTIDWGQNSNETKLYPS